MGTFMDLTGKRFGLLVAKEAAGRDPGGGVTWLCDCDCGSTKVITGRGLRRGAKSCGCTRIKHGHWSGGASTPTYRSWMSMHDRCRRERANRYQYYGGAGVTVCERWNDFANFLADMGERPRGMTLDREDPGGNYEPGNCRWATNERQSRNRGNVKLSMVEAVLMRYMCKRGMSQADVARKFDARQSDVSAIVLNRRWRWTKGEEILDGLDHGNGSTP